MDNSPSLVIHSYSPNEIPENKSKTSADAQKDLQVVLDSLETDKRAVILIWINRLS